MAQLTLSPQLAADLQQVDQVVRDRMRSQRGVVRVLGPYVGSGERVRAALALLAAQLGSYSLERVLHAASAVELIHAAISVHAQLVDGAARRGAPERLLGPFGHGVPLMIGDYLFALSAGEMALSPDARVIAFFAQAVQRYCEGELNPVRRLAPLDQAREQYLAYIGDTVGALFEAACKAGMATAGGSLDQIEALGRFGYELGLAAQLAADARDYEPGAHNSSPPANALHRGQITLPLIFAAAHDTSLASIADARLPNDATSASAIVAVQRYGVAPARDAARQFATRALEHLRPFTDSHVYPEIVALVKSIAL